MGYITEKEYEARMRKIEEQNKSRERKRKLREAKRKGLPKLKLPSTSKLILIGAVLLCLQIVIFCERMMMTFGDTSAMYVLVGIPATLIPIIWGYYSKAKAENTQGGITYDMAMMQLNQTNDTEDMSGMDDLEANG